MAVIEIINLEKLSRDGFKQPTNDPSASSPDKVTHAQLRYNDFSTTYKIQGTAVYNSSSTFEFSVSSAISNAYSLYKLFVSTDGTNYTEDKSYGGTSGRTLTGLNTDLLATNNAWTGANTFNTVMPSSTLTATGKDQFTTLRSTGLRYSCTLAQTGTNAPTTSNLHNTTGATAVWSYVTVGVYRLTFSNNQLFNNAYYTYNFSYSPTLFDATLGNIYGFAQVDTLSIASGQFDLYVYDASKEASTSGVVYGSSAESSYSNPGYPVVPRNMVNSDGILDGFFFSLTFFPV